MDFIQRLIRLCAVLFILGFSGQSAAVGYYVGSSANPRFISQYYACDDWVKFRPFRLPRHSDPDYDRKSRYHTPSTSLVCSFEERTIHDWYTWVNASIVVDNAWNQPTCSSIQVFDPASSQCVAAPAPTCAAGQVVDPATNTCVKDCSTEPPAFGNYTWLGSGGLTCSNGCKAYAHPDRHTQSGTNSAGETRTFAGGLTFQVLGLSLGACPVDLANADVLTSTPPSCPSGQHSTIVGGLHTCVADVDPPTICPAGTVAEMVGSLSLCLPPLSSTGSSGPSTTTQVDGTTVQSSESVSCTNGSCNTTTTITTTAAGGGSPTTTTQSEVKPQATFCQENPNAPVCKGSSATFGDCDQPPICQGDAVMCAVAAQAFKARCEAKADRDAAGSSASRLLGDLMAANNDPLKSTFPWANAETVNVPSSLETTAFLAGSCMSDYTFSVVGTSLTIPWSKACTALEPFRNVSLLLAGILSFFIVSGVVRREES